MSNIRKTQGRLLCGVAAGALLSWSSAWAQEANFHIAPQPLETALREFGIQSGVAIMADAKDTLAKRSPGFSDTAEPEQALRQLLEGTGLTYRRSGDIFIVARADGPQSGSAAGGGAEVEALIVTAQKREEDIQDVPIAISAFTQEALERSQVAGGPDLMTQVPNMTFTKTNFSSYSIQIRGIGTQAISATTDAAVAVAFNNTPFIRNRFFEQEFYDLQRVEVLRGPQGTLYGRNATAGVVNLISQKPKFGYEAKVVGDISNYSSTRLEGMVNVPLVEDKVALRLAGAWTKREGYVQNEITGNPIDGRDLWSTRMSLRFAPVDAFSANLIWEHFQENDDRLRSAKQLCRQDSRETLGGLQVRAPGINGEPGGFTAYSNIYSQGCLPASLYSPDSFQAPNGYSLPYYNPLSALALPVREDFNPYAGQTQSPDLRVIESTVDPQYRAKTDLVELQWDADIGSSLTLTSETGYLYDTIFSMEDFNRFNTERGAFRNGPALLGARTEFLETGEFGGIFCDPQIGCADRLVAIDVSRAKSSQFSQELRLSSDYQGGFNFSLGANFLRYDTEEKYYVFVNTLTMLAVKGDNFLGFLPPWQPGVSDNSECFPGGLIAPNPATYQRLDGCIYIDPNSIENVNDLGHNYFVSKNPYKLISYAVFGEAYYNITDALKLTAGLRWTVDKKEAPRIPSMLLAASSAGLSVLNVEEQEWREPTGRLALDWKPHLSFTDETLLYASYAHGYKAGGSNPPPSTPVVWTIEVGDQLVQDSVAKPKTFDPEFVDAFELGAKNTLLDGRLTLNLAGFYYDYDGYQVSQIIDRSAVNYNFDAQVWGLEIEADWRPLENLRLGLKGGYEKTRIADGEHAIDIMERNYGHGPDSADPWVVIRPFPTFPSNCVLPLYMFDNGTDDNTFLRYGLYSSGAMGPCEFAYTLNLDPGTLLPYVANPTVTTGFQGEIVPIETAGPSIGYVGYPGFNPEADYGANHGEGFFKPLGGNELPNAPHFTATITADFTVPLPADWLMTLHTDLYYQSEAWTRVFNMEGYDKLKAYSNINLAAIFTNEDAGWKVMAYVKNVMDRDSITGAFLNSDDTGLTSNVFLNEPRLYGLRVTKDWNGGPWWAGAGANHAGPYPLTIELSGQVQRQDAPYASVAPGFVDEFSAAIDPTAPQHRDLDWGDGREVRVAYRPNTGAWRISGAYRSGRANSGLTRLHQEEFLPPVCGFLPNGPFGSACEPASPAFTSFVRSPKNWSDSSARQKEDYTTVDFAVGRDFDFGLLGEASSTVALGLRYAKFTSTTEAAMNGVPDWHVPEGWAKYVFSPQEQYKSSHKQYRANLVSHREFAGFGPTLSWDAAHRLFGNEEAGHVDVDWSVTGGVLFGKQKMSVSGTEEAGYTIHLFPETTLQPLTAVPLDAPSRTTSATVPMLDLSLGLSYEVGRFKAGAGYRWERYFDVLDVGYDEAKDADRTIDGPYFKIAVGFGG
ncbi:MAG TPA: TonB-dependent receptor [Caulobacteraceae bacterium]